MDIWEDNVSMVLLIGGHLEVELDGTANITKAKKWVMKYHWLKDTLFFQNLVVLQPIEQKMLIENIHEEIGHFEEMRTLVEVKMRLFWHEKTKSMNKFIRTCEKCQLTKQCRTMRFGIEEMKSIPICDLFYCVAMDTTRPLPKTINGNKYVFIIIDHYSKWYET
jgi:hypothetical protein